MKPKGKVLIIGGSEDRGSENTPDMKGLGKEYQNFEILKELLPSGGSKKKIIIVSTASSVPDEMNEMYSKAFGELGFKSLEFVDIKTKEEAADPRYGDMVADAHAVFFTGGDKFSLAATLGGTEFIQCIRDKFNHDPDFVVAGTSAGAMAMSRIMIAQGGIHEALLKDDLRITSGLGIFDTCIIDTHFVKRGRFGRLSNAIIMNPEALGIGLGEDTALIIRNGEEAECRGSGAVIVIDGQAIRQTNIAEAADDEALYVENLIVHILAKGCRFSVKNREFVKPARKFSRQASANN